MDARFALIAWGGPEQALAARAVDRLKGTPGWRLHALVDGAALLVGAEMTVAPIGVLSQGPVLVGDVFDRRGGQRLMEKAVLGLTSCEATARHLSRACFGRYVALWLDADGRPFAYRDPSGAVEALCWRRDGLSLLCSHLDETILSAAPADLSLDWDRIDLYANHSVSLGTGSGFCAIHAIDPGALGGFSGERFDQTQIWRPADFLEPPQGSPEFVQGTMRQAVGLAVKAYDGQIAIAEVSGGLDSAIVAQARDKPGNSTRWLTYFGEESEADERAYARAVAGHLGIELLEVPNPQQCLVLADVVEGMRGPRPSMNGVDVSMDRGMSAQAASFGAEIILTGQGGDAVFFRSRTALIAEDALWDGLSFPSLPPLLFNLAKWTRRSVWSLGREALSGRLGRAATRDGGALRHPWLDLPPKTAPGKRMHVRQILGAQAFNGVSRRGASSKLVHPLLSQPVVELCLGLPAYQLTEGRRDRALARAAFAEALPKVTVDRRSKGDMTRHYGQMIARSLPLLRPFLLEGLLAEKGVLDRTALEEQLSPEDLIWRGDYAAILQWIAVEAWARRWSSAARAG